MRLQVPPVTTHVLDMSISKDRYLSSEFLLERSLIESKKPLIRDASFSARKGWIVDSNNITSDKFTYHAYDHSFASTQVIKYPGEFFGFHLGRWVSVGLSNQPGNTHWNCCPILFTGLSFNKGSLSTYTNFGVLGNVTYKEYLSFPPTEFRLQIGREGDLEFLMDNKLVTAIATDWIGVPYHLYGVGTNYSGGVKYKIPLKLVDCVVGNLH